MEDSGIDSGDHNGESDVKLKGAQNGQNSFGISDSSSADSSGRSPPRALPSTRQLQRQMESRIEQAKRSHQDYYSTPRLIPIQRLSIPGGGRDHQPLVQWDTDDSEEDIVNFFPLSRKESRSHQELTDTFSIEEMSISGDEDDLHLVPPQPVYRRFGCCPFSVCSLM